MQQLQITPLHCRLNVWHTWNLFCTDDGHLYFACARCRRVRTKRGLPAMHRPRVRPLHCWFMFRHTWRVYLTEDGGRYQACAECGKDRPDC